MKIISTIIFVINLLLCSDIMQKTELIFDLWNEDKKKIDVNSSLEKVFINDREIWYTKMGINVWYEENGKQEFRRPVLVIKKIWNLFFTVALTSKWKDNNKFYHKLGTAEFNENNLKNKDNSYCILSQVKVMDKKRFTESMWYISASEFFAIKEKLKAILL